MTREEYLKKLFEIYSLVAALSQNNDCRVLRLRNKTTGKDIVVHSLPKAVAAYQELVKIDCPNLPTIYDTIMVDDGQIVLEEYIDGVTVAQVMQAGKYRYIGAKKVLRAVCAALDVIHQRNIVHKDIKPENIMIDKGGRVVLIDFNVSRKITTPKKDTVVMGTAGYVSPEQLSLSQSSPRTDIYAVGILLNVMITGKHPSETLARGKAGRIVKKCTSVNPADRYETAKKLADTL